MARSGKPYCSRSLQYAGRSAAVDKTAHHNLLRLLRRIHDARLARGDEEEPAILIKRGRLEVRAASKIRKTLLVGAELVEHDRTPIGTNLAGPVLRVLGEGLGHQKLPGRAIERIEESVAVREHHDLTELPVHLDVPENWHFGRVPVVRVMRGELIMPFQLAGGDVDVANTGVSTSEALSPLPIRRRRSSGWDYLHPS